MDQHSRQVVSGPGVPPVIGPYSAGVVAGGFVHVSGQGGVDPATGQLAGPAFADQVRQALRNVEAVLHAAGSSLDRVVSTTVMLTDFATFAELNAAFAEFFPADPPARMTMQVVLPAPVLVSIGCVALAGAGA